MENEIVAFTAGLIIGFMIGVYFVLLLLIKPPKIAGHD
jgi:hypothetical protein